MSALALWLGYLCKSLPPVAQRTHQQHNVSFFPSLSNRYLTAVCLDLFIFVAVLLLVFFLFTLNYTESNFTLITVCDNLSYQAKLSGWKYSVTPVFNGHQRVTVNYSISCSFITAWGSNFSWRDRADCSQDSSQEELRCQHEQPQLERKMKALSSTWSLLCGHVKHFFLHLFLKLTSAATSSIWRQIPHPPFSWMGTDTFYSLHLSVKTEKLKTMQETNKVNTIVNLWRVCGVVSNWHPLLLYIYSS